MVSNISHQPNWLRIIKCYLCDFATDADGGWDGDVDYGCYWLQLGLNELFGLLQDRWWYLVVHRASMGHSPALLQEKVGWALYKIPYDYGVMELWIETPRSTSAWWNHGCRIGRRALCCRHVSSLQQRLFILFHMEHYNVQSLKTLSRLWTPSRV